MNDEMNRKTHAINKGLKDWYHQQNFGFSPEVLPTGEAMPLGLHPVLGLQFRYDTEVLE